MPVSNDRFNAPSEFVGMQIVWVDSYSPDQPIRQQLTFRPLGRRLRRSSRCRRHDRPHRSPRRRHLPQRRQLPTQRQRHHHPAFRQTRKHHRIDTQQWATFQEHPRTIFQRASTKTIRTLTEIGYMSTSKQTSPERADARRTTTVRLTSSGRRAFDGHLAAPPELSAHSQTQRTSRRKANAKVPTPVLTNNAPGA